ncbi:MAG: F-box protein [Chlamydiales bacterium]|nr:F-box protein [Chlamydiales bacterium]
MTVSYPSILSLYNHFRFVGVGEAQKSKWVNTDLELVSKPGFIKRVFFSDTDTKVASVLETISAEIKGIKNKTTKAYAEFVLGVLTIRSQKKDHDFGILSRINVARYLLSRADSNDSNFIPLQAQYEGLERQYLLGEAIKQTELKTLISAIKTLPMMCWGNFLPDVLMRVFEYLPIIDLANAAKANRHWNVFAQEAWRVAKRVPNVYLLSLARNYQTLPLHYVAENQKAIQAFEVKSLSSRKVCDLSLSGTLFQDAANKFTSDTNICVVTNNNNLIVIKTDPATKIQTKHELKNCIAKPHVHDGEVYLTSRNVYLARVDVTTGNREVLYSKVSQNAQCVSLYKSKAFFVLTNNHVVTVDLKTKAVSQTVEPLQGHIYRRLCYDRYIYSDQQTDLRVKNLSDPDAVDITLPETAGATVLSATPGLVVVIIPNTLKVAIFSLESGVKLFTCDSAHLVAMRATIHMGMLYLERGGSTLEVIDLSTKKTLRKIHFKEPTLCHPYLDKIFFATYPDFGWGPYALQEMA